MGKNCIKECLDEIFEYECENIGDVKKDKRIQISMFAHNA